MEEGIEGMFIKVDVIDNQGITTTSPTKYITAQEEIPGICDSDMFADEDIENRSAVNMDVAISPNPFYSTLGCTV